MPSSKQCSVIPHQGFYLRHPPKKPRQKSPPFLSSLFQISSAHYAEAQTYSLCILPDKKQQNSFLSGKTSDEPRPAKWLITSSFKYVCEDSNLSYSQTKLIHPLLRVARSMIIYYQGRYLTTKSEELPWWEEKKIFPR